MQNAAELIGILQAISIVAKSLAVKLMQIEKDVEDMETLEGSVMEYVRKTAEVMLGNSRRKDVESERETLGKKLDALRKEKERLSAEKMFLYDKYRSGGMTREQFKARTGAMAVRIEEIGMDNMK